MERDNKGGRTALQKLKRLNIPDDPQDKRTRGANSLQDGDSSRSGGDGQLTKGSRRPLTSSLGQLAGQSLEMYLSCRKDYGIEMPAKNSVNKIPHYSCSSKRCITSGEHSHVSVVSYCIRALRLCPVKRKNKFFGTHCGV